MKYSNSLKLARLASCDAWNGGASAMVIAKRALSITGSGDALDIVTTVYTHPRGKAVFPCRECGFSHLSEDDALTCCTDDSDFSFSPEDENETD